MAAAALPYQDSLLFALSKTTALDFDGNDSEQIQLYRPGTFLDVTSNQAIVRLELLKPHLKYIIPESMKEAQQLVEEGVDGATARDVASVAVDLMGVKLGAAMYPHIRPEGFVLSQSNPSAANSVDATVSHSRALVALFKRYGVPPSRLCIKIPSTLAGLQACSVLEKEGVRTLATVVYTREQGLAAGEAGCRYSAAYVNPLGVNFIPGGHVEHGFHGLPGFDVLKTVQATYRQKAQKTEIMSASLISVTEALSLAGLACSTLSPALLSLLAATPLTPELATQLAASSELYANAPAAPADVNCNVDTPEGLATVTKALEVPETKALMKEAVEIFGRFEMELLELAREEIKKLGDA